MSTPDDLPRGAPEIVCLRHELPDSLGIGEAVLREEGVALRYVELWQGEGPPALDGLAGVISLGGVMNADEVAAHPFLAAERAFLGECLDAGVPLLGICLGAQLMARCLGAPVEAGGARELGFLPVHPTPETSSDRVLGGFSEGDRVFRWHDDGFEVPASAELLLAGDAASPNQAFRAGRSWAVQFHPELSLDLLRAWLEMAGDEGVGRHGRTRDDVEAEAIEQLPAQERLARDLFRRFAREARSHVTNS
jgi:GMP synthase (glutamine-hydrolysing)